MTRLVVALTSFLALSSCASDKLKTGPSEASKDDIVSLDEPKTVATSALDASAPSTFELQAKDEAQPLGGTLKGKAFEPTLIYLREDPRNASNLVFSEDARAKPCEIMHSGWNRTLAIHPRRLVKQFKTEQVWSTKDLYTTGKSAGGDFEAKFVFDSIDREANKVVGRLVFKAGEGTNLSGRFEGVLCPSEIIAREKAGPIAGMEYGLKDVEPDKLPRQRIKDAFIIGKPKKIVAAIVSHHSQFNRYELALTTTESKTRCGDGTDDRFVFGLGRDKPAAGWSTAGTNTIRSSKDTHMTAHWNVDKSTRAYHQSGYRSVVIDSVSDDRVAGRIYAWFDDPGKSFVAGRFDAVNCISQ